MNYVHLRSFDNYVQANIQLGMLQERGINCHLQDEYTITIDPLLSNAIGGMKLMVFETQAHRALQLIEATEENSGRTWEDLNGGQASPSQSLIPTKKASFLQRMNEFLSQKSWGNKSSL